MMYVFYPLCYNNTYLPLIVYTLVSRKTRSLIRIGRSSLAVTVPKKWAERLGLEEGDPVYVQQDPTGKLVISVSPEKEAIAALEGVAEVGRGKEESVERIIIAYYQAGYFRIRIRFIGGRITARLRNTVRKSIGRLVGLEIIDEGSDYIVLETIVDAAAMRLDKVLSRMEILVVNSANDLYDFSVTGDKEILKTIIERDEDIDKFYFLLSRLVNMSLRLPWYSEKIGVEDTALLLPLYTYGKTIERIGDVLVSMARIASRHGVSRDNARIVLDTLRRAISAFKTGDRGEMAAVANAYNLYFSNKSLDSLEEYLTGNLLSLCLDILESKIEIEALKREK